MEVSESNQHGWKTQEHALYADTVRKFLAVEVVPNIEKWRKDGVVDRQLWTRAGEEGLLGATIPEAYGGGGVPLSFDAVLLYEHARCGDTGWGVAIQSIVAHYIDAYGTEEQKQRWLPALASGERIAAISMTEPGCGSDLQAVATTGRRENGELVLNGSKTFVTNGQLADLICVVARTEEAEGAKGLSLVFVETERAEGFRRGQNLEKIGMKSQDTSELFFENVRVPESNLLGGEGGRGFYQLMNQLMWERLILGVTALGAMDLIVDETVTYAKQRKLFGKRLFDLQNTRLKLAEAKTKAEVHRAFINDCLEKIDAGTLDPPTASMAKWWGTQMQCDVADECLQLFGGYGYMAEYPIARAYADARVQKIYGGANEVMKELIARSLDG
jgi:alkylation response protein AidB-like acyl-CoA dehydrogenase